MPEQKKSDLALRAKELRDRAGLSQQKLAEVADVSIGTVRNLEQGKDEDSAPSVANLRKIALALGVTVAALLGESPASSPPVKLEKVKGVRSGYGRFIPDLGKVAAGVAIDPKAEPNARFEVIGLPEGADFVTFIVDGNSMENAAILSGDRVIVRLTPEADSGEDVVAQINDNLTLKTFHVGTGDRKGYWLLPHSEGGEPIKVTAADDPRIIGVLYEVRRRVRTGRRKGGRK